MVAEDVQLKLDEAYRLIGVIRKAGSLPAEAQAVIELFADVLHRLATGSFHRDEEITANERIATPAGGTVAQRATQAFRNASERARESGEMLSPVKPKP